MDWLLRVEMIRPDSIIETFLMIGKQMEEYSKPLIRRNYGVRRDLKESLLLGKFGLVTKLRACQPI